VLNENGIILDLEGETPAFSRRDAVYDYDGNQLGWLLNAFFRDANGDAVAFMNGSVGGPLAPVPEFRRFLQFQRFRQSSQSPKFRLRPSALARLVAK